MRLIDADNVRDLFDAEFKETRKLILAGETHLDNLAEGFTEADRVIRQMPTVDAVPVVRCRDCKHSWEDLNGLCCSYGPCVDCPVSPDFWCANGRRREDAHAQD